ncbi:MAG TPA: VWA domain-containing protein [Acidimicrobiia bacterium]|nr:VWA domain-containing protein [Acidimicrobiia bacterium]
MTPDRLVALRAVAVVRWLRHHPSVEAGPGVRGSLALAEIAEARLLVGHAGAGSSTLADLDRAFLAAALVALPHRLRVRPGVDADALVRQAVEEALLEPPDPAGGPAPDRVDTAAASRGERRNVGAPIESSGRAPTTTEEEQALIAAFGDDEAARFLDQLLPAGSALPPTAGPAPTLPGRRVVGEEILAVRPFRAGDRARDFSARQTVRASLRHGAFSPRALSRQPGAVWDVVVAFDASASMGRDERPVVAPATAALARVLIRNGHRVGALAFSEEAVLARPLSRARTPLWAGEYAFADATNIEAGIDAARFLLLREAAPGARRHVILVTDAECTSHNGSDEAWGPLGAPRGSQLIPRLMSGGMVDAARRGALIAASRCRREGITVSVAYPDPRADVPFAHQLAAAGGGRARGLRP